ncbi:MAG: phosphatase PAP2 family protein [Pseudomonadota bacterium]|nr:phosphatase PAP2 family protein [Pseudomonadota bacterium]
MPGSQRSEQYKMMGGVLKCVMGCLLFVLNTEALVYRVHDRFTQLGDVLQVAIPLMTYGKTVWLDDVSGQKLFLKTALATGLETHLLKSVIKSKRPCDVCSISNRSCVCYDSFPSGHTSFAFSGPSFERYRYGFKASIPGYLLAALVGYSRVYGKYHYWRDVIAGASLAELNSYVGFRLSGILNDKSY